MTNINVRNVDPELRDKFRAICHMKGVSMNKRIIQMIEQEIDTNRDELSTWARTGTRRELALEQGAGI